MSANPSPSEYLVISRGQWDPDASKEQIQVAIDEFYVWIEQMIREGKMKTGQRLSTEGCTVSRQGIIADGPYGETKEVIGGYWWIVADSLDEAVRLASGNPCLRYGLFYEIRRTDPEKCSAFDTTAETPK